MESVWAGARTRREQFGYTPWRAIARELGIHIGTARVTFLSAPKAQSLWKSDIQSPRRARGASHGSLPLRCGAGLDEFLNSRRYGKKQIGGWFFCLLQYCNLFLVPRIRSSFAFVNVIECLQSYASQRRKSL